MKRALAVVLFRLFTIGVCVDGKEELVSVTEGDSVTLKSGVTEIQTRDEIEWRFSGSRIATITRDSSGKVKADVSFRDRLQLDNQTGDLKIINISTTDSGEYKPTISSTSGSPPEVTFTVKVVSAAAVKSVSVLVGDTVTLQTDLTEIHGDDVIQWRYGQQKSLVAEINRTAGIFNTYDGPDERFRGRLELNNQTGSLNITNINTTDSGLYEVYTSSSRGRHTIHHTQSFTVTVSDSVESVCVTEGDNVTLHTRLPGTERIEQIVWKFGDEVIADLNGPVNNRWIDANQTGNLTISNIQRNHSGHYKVEIITRTMILHRKYQITIDAVKSLSVKKGESVTLPITEIKNDDLIWWIFEDIDLAEINKTAKRFFIYYGPDERFRDRLKLDHQTGSLTITDTRTTHSGLYEVKIISSRYIINSICNVSVSALPHPGLSSATVAGFSVVVVLLLGAAAAAGVICYRYKKYKTRNQPGTTNREENRPNHALNGTQDTADRADEGTELTNTS